jgi:hypothetical protein
VRSLVWLKAEQERLFGILDRINELIERNPDDFEANFEALNETQASLASIALEIENYPKHSEQRAPTPELEFFDEDWLTKQVNHSSECLEVIRNMRATNEPREKLFNNMIQLQELHQNLMVLREQFPAAGTTSLEPNVL